MHFNIQRLVDDLGGATAVAKQVGIGRTVPYGWVRRSFISSHHLSLIKKAKLIRSMKTYPGPQVTVVEVEHFPVECDVHPKVNVLPVPVVADVVLWQALALD